MKSPKSSGKLKRPKLFLVRRVAGDSMLPTLRPGRVILASPRRIGAIREGDVVVIRHGGLEKVKRVQQVRADHLYVVGDNQAHSTDSRSFGWLHLSVVIAKVIWPTRLRRQI